MYNQAMALAWFKPRGVHYYTCRKTKHISIKCTQKSLNAYGVKNGKLLQLERSKQKPTARTFNMTVKEAMSSDDVVTGTLSINNISAYVLFDSRATRSFISEDFAKQLKLSSKNLDESLLIEITSQEGTQVEADYPQCVIEMVGHKFLLPVGVKKTTPTDSKSLFSCLV